MAEQRQDTLNKRKVFTRSDAVVGDDENKEELSIKQAESPKKQLFRDLSYADSMGIDVLRFVENTLHKNAKDREFLLFIEEETRKFVEDESKSYHWFPPTSSYNRMLIHRVAAFFGLIHNVDQSGQQVVITKQKGHTRIPDIKFSSLIKHSNFEDKFHFGRRNVQSFDESNISTLCNHRSTTNFGGPPPSSYRPFRNRFYTSGGSQFNNNNNKSRRTRSFEISDWTNSSSTTLFNQQQQQQFAAWLQPSNLEIVTAGGEGMSTSNCSSSASSGAVIHHQMAVGGNGSCGGGGGIPFQIYPTGQILLTNEPSLISPTSAFSEPIITNNQQQQQLPPIIQSTNGIVEKSEEGGEKDQQQLNNLNILEQQRSQIPSLFSIQPLMSPPIMPSPNTTATNILPNQQQYINPYMALQYQYQPMMINNAANPAAQYQYFTDNANILHYYPTYYPIYQPHQQQTFIDPYHPLIEENDNNNTRPSIIENQFESLSINQETTPPKCNNNNGNKKNNKNNNNNGVGKPSTCY